MARMARISDGNAHPPVKINLWMKPLHGSSSWRGRPFGSAQAGCIRSPRRPFPGTFEFASIRADSWLRWHSIFNHIWKVN
jgi:hypothetical protein